MEKRFVLFLVLAFVLLGLNQAVLRLVRGPAPVAQQAEKKPADPVAKGKEPLAKADAKAADPKAELKGDPKPADPPAADPDNNLAEKEPADKKPLVEQEVAHQNVSLGSADPASPFRMLVTLTNRGAAIERIELNSPRYRELEVRSGYLGHLDLAEAKGGLRVGVVGRGTPAQVAGLEPEDLIVAVGERKTPNLASFVLAMESTKPDEEIELHVRRDDKPLKLAARLGREPLSLIRPELDSAAVIGALKPGNHDPLSLLLSLDQAGDEKIEKASALTRLLDGTNWEVVKSDPSSAEFRKVLAKQNLEVIKRYTLARNVLGGNAPAYHLNFAIEIRNTGEKATKVAYRLGGPTGLPTEGHWYANKVGRGWGAAGLRDVLVRFEGQKPTQVTTAEIADDKAISWIGPPLQYVAVDAQYFAAALIPIKPAPAEALFAEVKPVRVGSVPKDKALHKLVNASYELTSNVEDLPPGGALQHEFQFFAGPKDPAVLAEYGPAPATLSDLVYYGWFFFVATPMLSILHAFYFLVGNYGIAIIMLTVLVRGCMFPLSRKQAVSAQKMQELQPEVKRIAEKYKKNPEQRAKAQQELFRKNNYNPMGGCLLMFIQLPIFVGLYRSLMVDVELRQAPLFGETIRWASNLAAPDMFLDWSAFMPEFITQGTGFFGLGPYLNIFPLVTICLFIWQQKMFMPPPGDEQQAMQQKIMQYMMIFMGFMFFKVASGLCIYFIASSLWGIAERKLLPKTKPPGGQPAPQTAAKPALPASGNGGNGASGGKKKQRDRR